MKCNHCGGRIDPEDLGSVFHHEHRGLDEPWGIKGTRVIEPEPKKQLPYDDGFHTEYHDTPDWLVALAIFGIVVGVGSWVVSLVYLIRMI